MRRNLTALSILLAFSLFSAYAVIATDLSEDSIISGKWSLTADAGGQSIQILVDLKQTGSDFTGTTSSDMGGGMIDGGKVTGKTFTGMLHADIQGNTVDFKIDGVVDGDKMTGTFTNPSFGSIPFAATKEK
ncbi:MAG TPA: hypothetical protein PLD38_13645 [Pyrinomonadaceae bacterium]|nr:hypothetical protein [Chloracidobacterium sp.]MBP9936161.1 hypothetical protein [Pyrinomonadaceae bacterium]MBK7804498.1 hypothetical protein [Chloracidobacterium sp.]MBK9438900.1 hypothetical protein [Chloracidobacterium sp.]MBL0240431.1 hypothetical protein [Chloracidobacterium sp.]